MGLLVPVCDFLLREHKHKPITGEVLFIGRQTVFLDEKTLPPLLTKHGLQMAPDVELDKDTKGVAKEKKPFVTDRYFMRCLGVDRLRFLDVSAYEGADIVHDLGFPVPPELENRFDFIYNGGCLDNMFNPGVAMMNLSKMLKPGGRIVCMESGSSFNEPYLIYSPGWFFDYYVTNRFSDCKVYVCSYPDHERLYYGPWRTFYFDWKMGKNGPTPEAIHRNHIILLTIAEKGPESTSGLQPIQHQYRHDREFENEFEKVAKSFGNSQRPILNGAAPRTNYLSNRILRVLCRMADKTGFTLYRSQRHLQPVGTLGN